MFSLHEPNKINLIFKAWTVENCIYVHIYIHICVTEEKNNKRSHYRNSSSKLQTYLNVNNHQTVCLPLHVVCTCVLRWKRLTCRSEFNFFPGFGLLAYSLWNIIEMRLKWKHKIYIQDAYIPCYSLHTKCLQDLGAGGLSPSMALLEGCKTFNSWGNIFGLQRHAVEEKGGVPSGMAQGYRYLPPSGLSSILRIHMMEGENWLP